MPDGGHGTCTLVQLELLEFYCEILHLIKDNMVQNFRFGTLIRAIYNNIVIIQYISHQLNVGV